MRLWWLLLVLAALPLALAAPVCTAQDKCGSEECGRSAGCYWQEDRNCGTLFYCYAYSVGSYAIDIGGQHKLGYWPPQRGDTGAWGMEAYLFTYTIRQGWYSYGKTAVWGIFENFTYGVTFARVTYQIVGKHCNCQLNWEVTHILSENYRQVNAPKPPETNVTTIKQEWSTSSGAQSQVTVTACGSGGGWAWYEVFAGLFRVGVYIYGDVQGPPSLSWVGFAARTVDGRFALANASFLYQADNYNVYRVTLGSLGALRAYWWNATALQGVWIAETGINWGYQYGYQWRWVGEPAGMRGFYDFGTVSSWAGWIGIYSRPLTGTYLLKLSISVYGDWVELQVEDPPGSGQYVTIVRGTDGGYGDYAGISYNGVLTLNNQRLRIAAYYHSEGYKGDGRMSGYAILFNPSDPSKLAPDAQPVWWEVYREGSLYANITGPSTPRYNGDGSNWRMIAVYQATPSYRITLTVRTHDGRPANGTIVRVTSGSGTVYVNTTDSNGVARFTLPAGSYSVLINETYYGPTLTAGGQSTRWRRYRFWKWSDESTDNPRTVNLNSDTNLTAYVWDERALLVRWEPHFDGDAWGVLNATSGARIAYDSIVWMKRGQTVQLLPVEAGGLIFTYWRVGTECYRGQPYSSDPLLTLTVGDRGLSAIAVFRLAATNQTMLPPGAGMVNPVTYIPGATMGGEERMGRRGWWLMTVTHVVTNKTSPSEAGIDGRAWIYALIVNENGSSRWVPVTGVWRLQLAQDWDPSKHVRDLPGGVKIIEWNRSTIAGFPKIQDPQEWREWYFVTLSAWDPLVYEELGGSYDTSGLWLANGSTLALYNITFAYMGVNGDRVEYVYWQPIA
ncbi:MAG: hypothetical protein QXZ31_11335, partial [Thermofilaceae archaeon]